MTTYRLYDLALESDDDLAELEPVRAAPTIRVRRRTLAPASGRWIDIWPREDGAPWIQCQRNANAYRIRYVDQVEFEYDPPARTIHVDVADCASATVRHCLLDQVVPLALSLEASVLHASATVIDGAIVAFAGPCGAGKSTLAAVLERCGYPIACDDGLLLRRSADVQAGAGTRSPSGAGRRPVGVGTNAFVAVPPYPGLRLWPDMRRALAPENAERAVTPASRKLRVRGALRFHSDPAPLDRIYLVDSEDASCVRFTRLTPRDAAVVLLEHTFCLEQRDAASLERRMDRSCACASSVAVWRLEYPRDPSRWGEVASAILRHARVTVSTHAATRDTNHAVSARR
ncbi:MAG TPA: hypothetical protein VGL62_00945 [Vicinamibacterales bacterium]